MVKKWKQKLWFIGAVVVLGMMVFYPKEALDAARALAALTGESTCSCD